MRDGLPPSIFTACAPAWMKRPALRTDSSTETWYERYGMSPTMSARGAPRDDGARVVEHVVDGDAERVGIAEDDHAEGVADEDDVGAGGVGDLRAGIVVGGDHADALRRPSSRGRRGR